MQIFTDGADYALRDTPPLPNTPIATDFIDYNVSPNQTEVDYNRLGRPKFYSYPTRAELSNCGLLVDEQTFRSNVDRLPTFFRDVVLWNFDNARRAEAEYYRRLSWLKRERSIVVQKHSKLLQQIKFVSAVATPEELAVFRQEADILQGIMLQAIDSVRAEYSQSCLRMRTAFTPISTPTLSGGIDPNALINDPASVLRSIGQAHIDDFVPADDRDRQVAGSDQSAAR